MVLSDELYNRVYKGVVMRGLAGTKERAGVIVKNLHVLNQVAYNLRYQELEEIISWEVPNDDALKFDIPPVIVRQLVRDLEAIQYNIQDGEVSDWLDDVIYELKESAEYKNNPSFERYTIY